VDIQPNINVATCHQHVAAALLFLVVFHQCCFPILGMSTNHRGPIDRSSIFVGDRQGNHDLFGDCVHHQCWCDTSWVPLKWGWKLKIETGLSIIFLLKVVPIQTGISD